MNGNDVKIGIALSGGGAKGGAHIGVMKVLEKYGIKPSIIAGTSIGAIIGALYGLGYTTEEVIRRTSIMSVNFSNVRNFRLFGDSLVSNNKINPQLKRIFEDTTFKDLKIPVIINATDLESGKEVIIKKGKLWQAVRSSASVPFIFKPVFLNQQYLVDGGVINNIPLNHIREYQKDIDILIGVSLGGMTSRQYISAMVWRKYYDKPKSFRLYPSIITRWKQNTNLLAHIMIRSLDIAREISQKEIIEKAKPDFIINPHVEDIPMLDFSVHQKGIARGVEEVEKIIPDLLKLIEKKQKEKELQKVKKQIK